MSKVETIADGIKNLEPLPASAQRLLAATSSGDVELSELVEIVEMDEALSANVLRTVNSSRFGGRREIQDIRSAVIRLGSQTLSEIAMGAAVQGMSCDAPMYSLDEHELWRHSAVAALAAKEIQKVAVDASIPPAATTAALLHDLGKLILVRYADADVQQLVSLCDEKQMSYVEAERELIGWDHAQVGGEVARSWGFPDEIRMAIEKHHDIPLEDSTPLLDVVVTANFVCKTIGVGLGAAGMNMKMDAAALERLGLSYDMFCSLCAVTTANAADLG